MRLLATFENTQWEEVKQMCPMKHCRPFENLFETHSEKKTNKCKQCDSITNQAGDLRRHLKTHSGEKSNKCT